MPPLTPGTNQKMTQVLLASYSSFEKERDLFNIPKGNLYSSKYINLIVFKKPNLITITFNLFCCAMQTIYISDFVEHHSVSRSWLTHFCAFLVNSIGYKISFNQMSIKINFELTLKNLSKFGIHLI